ncbi:MAG: 4Fe-4S dicluster domain-containing protein [Coriobacteriales bacterium]|jgi:anaerobic dimethyl sulfoxide reductase subunit B (iron-sulfur subunit)|nr:4Fe-4S dicluster domain-containing protein [Coriobacteriales bacterium]
MGNLGFYFDSTICIGCRTCQVACKDRSKTELGTNYRIVRSYESGLYPEASIYHYSASCNHCEAPACVSNCPTGAMQKDIGGDGTVQHDDELCIGCGSCVKSCPYQVPVLLTDKGIAGKCDACKPFRDAGKNPVCVDACVMRCLDFGDTDELREKYAGELTDSLPCLPSPDATLPTTLIAPKQAALDPDFREVAI